MENSQQLLWIGVGIGWFSLFFGTALFIIVRRWIQKRRFGPRLDHSALLVGYTQQLARAETPEALSRFLTNVLPGELQVDQSVLLLPRDQRLCALDGVPLELPVHHAGVRRVAASGEAQLADRGQLQVFIQQTRTDLTWTHVWVPLMRSTRLLGLWLLGARRGGQHYANADLHWLTALAREAAAVLETFDFEVRERMNASEMRTLYRQLVKTREMERSRLARELHDGVLQDLCAVTRDLKALQHQSSASAPHLVTLTDQAGDAVHALRAICNDLRPPLLQQDLVSALRGLVAELDARSTMPVSIEISVPLNALNLTDEAALAVFRITQEAIHNAVQHADASEIAVRLTRFPDRLRLTVADDGRGIRGQVDPPRFVAEGHFGLAGMRERASMIGGTLEIQTAQDYGTIIIFELPTRANGLLEDSPNSASV